MKIVTAKPIDDTDSILQKLEHSPFENIVVHMNGGRYLLPVATIKALTLNSIPDVIKDENSPDAKKYGVARTGIKALIRPFLPDMLRKMCGAEIEIKPRLNVLSWLPNFLVQYLVNVVASREWVIHVEQCEDCGQSTYQVVGISPNTNGVTDPKQIPATTGDSQPL